MVECKAARWRRARDPQMPQPFLADAHLQAVGLIDETRFANIGDQTPGGFQAQLDAKLFLPENWIRDREQCRG